MGGPWREATPFADCVIVAWAPDGSGALCQNGSRFVLYSRLGRAVWRRDLAATAGVDLGWGGAAQSAAYSRDSRTLYAYGSQRDGRSGRWAIPVAGGAPRLVIRADPAFPTGSFSVGTDRLYLLVSQDESDIWVARLNY
ncbi:MAG: hypothetical protein FIB01_09515 [Gemmatimonadetes bacterium]|nr:hypothetical protein [Gemmatimonadota bacterium]